MSPRRDGFTLLEVIVALAILGVFTVAALAGVGQELRAADTGRTMLDAAALADDRLEMLRLADVGSLNPLPDSLARGTFPAPFERYRWQATARPTMEEQGLYDVEVRVVWDGGVYPVRAELYRPPAVTP